LHRTDRLSAAVHDHCDKEFFTQRYRGLLAHYGLKAQAIAARQAHQNADVEKTITDSKPPSINIAMPALASLSPLLDLKRLYSNCHAFRRGERRGGVRMSDWG
jgi:hypothetical protein